MSGYKNPPLHSRFQKGKSGNPKGRPKKQFKGFDDALAEALSRKIPTISNFKEKKLPAYNVLLQVIIGRAIKDGDTRAICFLLNKWQEAEKNSGRHKVSASVIIVDDVPRR